MPTPFTWIMTCSDFNKIHEIWRGTCSRSVICGRISIYYCFHAFQHVSTFMSHCLSFSQTNPQCDPKCLMRDNLLGQVLEHRRFLLFSSDVVAVSHNESELRLCSGLQLKNLSLTGMFHLLCVQPKWHYSLCFKGFKTARPWTLYSLFFSSVQFW